MNALNVFVITFAAELPLFLLIRDILLCILCGLILYDGTESCALVCVDITKIQLVMFMF